MRIRPYEPPDNEQRHVLDLSFPVGCGIRICRQYRHLVSHAEMYERHHTLVAEDDGKVIGVASGAIKHVRLSGNLTKVGYMFGMRVAPEVRRQGVAFALHSSLERILAADGAEAVYAIILASNASVRPLIHKVGFQKAGAVETLIVPVLRRRPVRTEVRVQRRPAAMSERIDPFFGGHDLFVPGPQRYPAVGEFALYHAEQGSSFAAVTLSARKQVFQDVVLSTPAYAGLLRCLLATLRPLGPAPRIPTAGQIFFTCYLGEPVIHGPDGAALFQDVMNFINNRALADGIGWLSLPVNMDDPLRAQIRETASVGRLSRIARSSISTQSVLLTKPLAKGVGPQFARVYLDTRDL